MKTINVITYTPGMKRVIIVLGSDKR